jgi:hypothetical protein
MEEPWRLGLTTIGPAPAGYCRILITDASLAPMMQVSHRHVQLNKSGLFAKCAESVRITRLGPLIVQYSHYEMLRVGSSGADPVSLFMRSAESAHLSHTEPKEEAHSRVSWPPQSPRGLPSPLFSHAL